MFKGEVPEEDNKKSDNITQSKNAELEQMRKSKRQHRDHFKMMEAGKLPEQKEPNKRRGDTKLLVGKLKDVSTLYTLTYLIILTDSESLAFKFFLLTEKIENHKNVEFMMIFIYQKQFFEKNSAGIP